MKKAGIFLLLVLFSGGLPAARVLAEAPENRYRAATDRAYEDVVEDVEFAISEHNFRLTGGNSIGAAIAERRNEAFPKSEIIHFCNLEYARRFLLAAPDYLLHMPCKIVVYEADGRVFVEARLLPEDDQRVAGISKDVNRILRAIVDYATEP